MPARPLQRPAYPFFLSTPVGRRFCLFHFPEQDGPDLGAVLYVPPFGEEMNKARRMAALQSKRFARMGIGVLQIDLFGCGDSSGELSDASWERWKDDLCHALTWLRTVAPGPIHLWGLRLGALLALDVTRSHQVPIDRLILWQPVVSGEAFLSQFLRLKLASDVVSGNKSSGVGVRQLRETLKESGSIQIAGYDLPSTLATAIDALHLEELAEARSSIDWFEIALEHGREIPLATKRVAAVLERKKINCRIHVAVGPAFWNTQEITECPDLLELTSSLFAESCQ